MIAKFEATWCTISELGEESCETILTLSSKIPVGVCGETENAGDIDSEQLSSGVSRVVGGATVTAT
jgi:hypothetical protein